jgi:hypothetical protein
VHSDAFRFFAWITRQFLRNRTNSIRRYEITKSKELRFRASLGEKPEIEVEVV